MNKYLLHHLLDEAAMKFPDKKAFVYGENSITYKELEYKSNQLANMLVDIGFKPRNVVGIYLNKSIEAIIAIFAVLKAGGAYVPIDSHYSPMTRIKNIIKLSQAEFIISDTTQWKVLESSFEAEEEDILRSIKVIFADGINGVAQPSTESFNIKEIISGCYFYADYENSTYPQLRKEPEITSDDLAYILYTSGSTGQPKGVMLTHLNAMTFINWSLSYFKPNSSDIFSNFAPFHFDLSIFDIFVSVGAGACSNLLPFQLSSNPRAIVDWLSKSNITYMYSVPSVWVSIMNYATIRQEDLKNLKHILFAGEVFPPKYLKKLMEILPHTLYYNLYGPTETNVCTYYQVKSIDDVTDRPVPIGQACANTEVLVLNERDELVAEGEEGELLVKGSIVTKGYYKDEEKTKSAFRKSPMPYHNGALLYRTGDIVRRCKDNIYEYVGRRDMMVKCSGFRIELQEIEHALYKHTSIEEAVAVPVYDEKRENTSIYAIVKIKAGESFSVTNIKKFLIDILPKYMIPEFIESIDEMPKNSNGKIDRQKVKVIINEKRLEV